MSEAFESHRFPPLGDEHDDEDEDVNDGEAEEEDAGGGGAEGPGGKEEGAEPVAQETEQDDGGRRVDTDVRC